MPEQDLWKTRMHLLDQREQEVMDSFIERKMEELKERINVDWDMKKVKRRMSKLLSH